MAGTTYAGLQNIALQEYLAFVDHCVAKQSALSPQLQLLLCKVDMLLPGVLLRWAASMPATHPDAGTAFAVATQACGVGLRAFQQPWVCEPAATAAAGGNLQPEPADNQQAPGVILGVSAEADQQLHSRPNLGQLYQHGQVRIVPSRELLAEVLPLATRLCTAWQQQLQQQQGSRRGSSAAAGHAPAGSGSATGASSTKEVSNTNNGSSSSSSTSSSRRNGMKMLPSDASTTVQVQTAQYNVSALLLALIDGAVLPACQAAQGAAGGAEATQAVPNCSSADEASFAAQTETAAAAAARYVLASADIFLEHGCDICSMLESRCSCPSAIWCCGHSALVWPPLAVCWASGSVVLWGSGQGWHWLSHHTSP
jgi:hypothetical protein